LEGEGKMFHGNFWANIEMNFESGLLEEHDSRIQSRAELSKMTDANWMYKNLKDDIALQLYLYKQGKISDIDVKKLKKLAEYLEVEFNSNSDNMREEAEKLLDSYAYAATRYILQKSKDFAHKKSKKLMVVIFDPYTAMKQLLEGEPRIDQEIVDFLNENEFNYFDMNEVHDEDYKQFKPDIDAYYERYFIGHYSPVGNHFFAYSLAPKIVKWLNPKSVGYLKGEKQNINFDGYLEQD